MSFKFREPEVSQRSMERVYKPLQGITTATGPRIALLILNWPLHGMLPKLNALWSKACVKMCVDGGANHLFDVTKEDSSEELTPDIISGDFDSARENVLEYYSNRGCEIVRTPDQNETDFTKALVHLMSRQDKFDFEEVVALCGFGSRLDQLFANVDTLFKVSALTSKPVYLLSEDSLSVLLRPGHHTIFVNTGLEDKWCGLIPVGVPCGNITTTGLKWNLTQGNLEFGTLISTSNTWDGTGIVSVENSNAVLWTMGVTNGTRKCLKNN